MQTGLNKLSTNVSSSEVSLSKMISEKEPVTVTSILSGFSTEAMFSVTVKERLSEGEQAVVQAAKSLFNAIAKLPLLNQPLSGRATSKPHFIFFSTNDFCKHVEQFAKEIKQEIEFERQLTKTRTKHEAERKERQRDKCNFFWKKAENLFHLSYERILNERIRIATNPVKK